MVTFIATIQQTYRHKSGKTKTRRVVRPYKAESAMIAALAAKGELTERERVVSIRREGDTYACGQGLLGARQS